MEYPKMIKGIGHSYSGADTDVEVPIEDISIFELYHESGRNGLQVRATIKKELIDKWDSGYINVEEKKYRIHQRDFIIRIRDMPKFRKELVIELQKTPTIIIKEGINAGTPIAQNYTFKKKELKVVV